MIALPRDHGTIEYVKEIDTNQTAFGIQNIYTLDNHTHFLFHRAHNCNMERVQPTSVHAHHNKVDASDGNVLDIACQT